MAEQRICQYYDFLVNCTNPGENNGWGTPTVHPCRKTYDEFSRCLDENYVDLVNTVQRHSQVRTEIIGKRNDERVNRHQQIQLQGWRANCDIHHACVKYRSKYASKAEKISSAARDAFFNVISNLKNDSSPKSAISHLMIKSVGERDMGIHEVMHLILSLKLHHSTYRVITVSLDNSSKCEISCSELSASKSDLKVYAERQQLGKDLQNTNFISFIDNYSVNNGKLSKRRKLVIVRTIPNYSSNPKGENYGLYCKYQLLKFKPWHHNPSKAWNDLEQCDQTYVSQWQNFLESDLGKSRDWQRQLEDTLRYYTTEDTQETDATMLG